MNSQQSEKLEFIVKHRDFEKQLEQAIEEASEFILAAQKLKRYPDDVKRKNDLIEETGDLLIMMEQMRAYLGCEQVDESIDFKLDRELMRIQEVQHGEN